MPGTPGENAAGWTLRRGRGVSEIRGVRVGTYTNEAADTLSGTTVVVPPPATVAGADVRGGGPAVHETEILRPGTLGDGADAVVLTGGSAYGLAAARGVQDVLARSGVGSPVPGGLRVPIVPAAAIFDLGRGRAADVRAPGANEGIKAAEAALAQAPDSPAARGSIGAGVGAWCAGGLVRGGTGQAVVSLGDVTVAAMTIVNAHGTIVDTTGWLYGASVLSGYGIEMPRVERSILEDMAADRTSRDPLHLAESPRNTTIACIVTNAALDPAETTRVAATAHAGMARAIYPSHTLFDGDSVFALATGQVALKDEDPVRGPGSTGRPQLLTDIGQAAADALTAAIVDGVLCAGGYSGGQPTAASPAPMAHWTPALADAWAGLD